MRVFDGFQPFPDRIHQRDPIKALSAPQNRHFSYHCPLSDSPFGLCACLRKKGTRKRCSSRVSGASVQPIVMIFGAVRNLGGLINLAKLFIDQFKGHGLRKGQTRGSPTGNCNGPAQLNVALSCTNLLTMIIIDKTFFSLVSC